MESQVIRLLELKREMDLHALGRHISINNERYEDAMTSHFLFYSALDEFQTIKRKLNQKETDEFLGAMFCLDYRFK